MSRLLVCLIVGGLGLLFIAVVAVIAVVVAKPGLLSSLMGGGRKSEPAGSQVLPYVAKRYLFSRAENSFFQTLRQAVGDRYVIFAKVRLEDVIEVSHGAANYQTFRNRIKSRHLDFVLCDPKEFRPMAAIELDDRSHERSDRAGRDEFVDAALKAAGLPCIHIPAAYGYSPQDLLRQITAAGGAAR
jgi:hypothetical protein